jgi:monomeric sarcosine oxidase
MADVVVVGAGVFGLWTAYHLQAAGARVVVIDAYGAANPRASSSDQSRILRFGYGPDDIYATLARRSLDLWKAFEARVSPAQQIWHPCGVLWLATADDAYTAATRHTLESGGYGVQMLDADDLRERYPHLAATDMPVALLETDGGALMARRAVRLLAVELERSGTPCIRGQAFAPPAGQVRSLQLTDGRQIEGDGFVFACGPWLPTVFPTLLAGRIRPTRQTVVYFGTPAGDDRFGPSRTPAWIDRPAGIYGVPELEDGGLKIGIDEHGPAFNPDHDDRTADPESIARMREWLARRFPDLADAPVVGTRVCQYENTSNGDFLIDRHPMHDNVWVVGGGSGHGFKHGPAVGEHAATMVLTGREPHLRFSLATKGIQAQRAVF